MSARIIRATTEKRQELGKLIPLSVPFTVEIFPSNVCNFKCKYCAQSVKSKEIFNEYMEWDIYRKAIDDLSTFPYPIKLLLLAGLGEPLIHPDIARMVQYAKEKKVADMVRIITNASLLTHEMSDALIDAGLDHLKVSIQGLTDATYRDMCDSKISLETIIDNLKYFYEHKRNTIVNVKIVADAFRSPEDEDQFYKMFENVCDVMNVEHIAPYQESVNYDFINEKHVSQTGTNVVENRICQLPFYFCSVYPDGEIIPCCLLSFEEYKKFSLGNVKNVDLAKTWNGTSYNNLRLKLLKDERDTLPVCCNCGEFFKSQCQPGDNIDLYVPELIKKYTDLV